MNYKRIIIDSLKLTQIIDKNYPKYNRKTISYFSIFVTLIITLSTIEEFRDFGNIISNVQIKYLLYFSTLISLCLTLYEYFRKPPYSKESIISEIGKESLNITKDVALFIFMKDITDNKDMVETKILFSDAKEWDSYLLPFCKKNDNHTDQNLCKFIEKQFSLSVGSINLDMVKMLNFLEEKNSATSGKMTQYNYTTYYVLHNSKDNIHMDEEEFNIGKRKYKWLSLEEVKVHSKTMYLNRKVIRMIDDNFSALLMDYKLPSENIQ